MNYTQSKKMALILEILKQDDNEENLLNWASAFLGSLSYKSIVEIYNREVKQNENK